MAKAGIYKIVNNTLSKGYVGKSLDVEARVSEEFNELKTGNHHNLEMQRDYLKQKGNGFSAQWVEQVSEPTDLEISRGLTIRASILGTSNLEVFLSDRERAQIVQQGTMSPSGYNARLG